MERQLQIYCSKETFAVARVIAAIMVFLSHSFFFVHQYFGFFFVGVFFFISGYGMEFTSSRMRALLRMPRFLVVFAFFSFIYFFMYGDWYFPTAWFLLSYSMNMVIYRFFGRSSLLYYFVFVFYLYFLSLIDFNFYEFCLPFGFLLGVFTARYHYFLPWSYVLIMFSVFTTYYSNHCLILFVLSLPMAFRLILWIASRPCFSFLSRFSYLTFPFFSLHCWFLGLFHATWTLGGHDSYYGAFFAFLLSLMGAYLLWRYVPLFSKKKFWIFQ